MTSSNDQNVSGKGSSSQTGGVAGGAGVTVRVDPYGRGVLSEKTNHPPAASVLLAAANVNDQGILDYVETYSLLPGVDDRERYELWASHQLSREGEAWVAAEWVGGAATAAEVSETLLVGLWKSRGGPVALESFVDNCGCLSQEALERIYRAANRLDIPPDVVDAADGVGTVCRADGSIKYRGDLHGDVPHGKGTAYWQSGAVACEGEFKEGQPNGQVRIYYPNGVLRYEGNCEDSYPFGKGTEYHKNGKVWFNGIFGRQFPARYGYGARNYGRGRLYRDSGELVHDGEFESVGSGHSRPKRDSGSIQAIKEEQA